MAIVALFRLDFPRDELSKFEITDNSSAPYFSALIMFKKSLKIKINKRVINIYERGFIPQAADGIDSRCFCHKKLFCVRLIGENQLFEVRIDAIFRLPKFCQKFDSYWLQLLVTRKCFKNLQHSRDASLHENFHI